MVNVNTMDLGRGFLKLQEDNNSRRSSSLFRTKPLELNENGLHYVTRINCGCGQCVPFRVKVERDDGGLRIGKLTLATNCHLIIVIFGFFFLIAGSVLTALAYKEPVHDDLDLSNRASSEHLDSPSRQEGKVAGPIFIIVGSALVLMGFLLTALSCKLNREAKRQLHLSRFTWETPPLHTPDIFNSTTHHGEHYAFANLDTFSIRSRDLSTGSGNSGGARRDSSFTFTRQQQHPPPPLSTIAQAVPVGIFLFGGGPESTTSPKSPTIQVTDPSGFQEIELGSPTTESAPASASLFGRNGSDQYRKHRSQSDGGNAEDGNYEGNKNSISPNDPRSQSKVNLALRPSLPIIPMFATAASPHYFSSRVVTPLDARNLYVSSRSDEPFGSIASLSTSGDIACFPITQSVKEVGIELDQDGQGIAEEKGDDESSTSPQLPKGNRNELSGANNNDRVGDKKRNGRRNSQNDVNLNTRNEKDDVISNPKSQLGISDLPPINVNDSGKLDHSTFQPKSILKQSKEDWSGTSDEEKGGKKVKG